MVMFTNFSLYKASINILTILFSSTFPPFPPPIKHGLLKTPAFVDDFHIEKGDFHLPHVIRGGQLTIWHLTRAWTSDKIVTGRWELRINMWPSATKISDQFNSLRLYQSRIDINPHEFRKNNAPLVTGSCRQLSMEGLITLVVVDIHKRDGCNKREISSRYTMVYCESRIHWFIVVSCHFVYSFCGALWFVYKFDGQIPCVFIASISDSVSGPSVAIDHKISKTLKRLLHDLFLTLFDILSFAH